MRYAQLDNNGVCISDSNLAGVVDDSRMIELGPDEPLRVGHVWSAGVWIAPKPPTAEELLAQEREKMVCSSAQGEIALRQAGLLDKVLAVVSTDPVLDIAWRRAGEWRRTSATMKTLIGILGWTDEFVDDLFRAAMRIEL